MIDIVFYDANFGWGPTYNATHPVGGWEVYQTQMATWFAASGLRVVALQRGGSETVGGVEYIDTREFGRERLFKTYVARVCITGRHSALPTYIGADSVFTSVVDDPRFCDETYDHLKGRSTLVCISDWQRGLYQALGHDAVTIRSCLDDDIYEWKRPEWAEGFVCVNAWNKGTEATLAMWRQMKAKHTSWKATLRVGSPYSHPADAAERCSAAGASWIGTLSPRQVVTTLASAEAVFRVNAWHPETFGVCDAIAEAVGTRVHCLFTGEVGASPEAIVSPYLTTHIAGFQDGVLFPNKPYPRAKDWRVSTIMPQWLKLLGLGGAS